MYPKYRLIPRFHYTFRFKDLIFSYIPSKINRSDFIKKFGSGEIYFLNGARTGIYLLLKSLHKDKPIRVGIQPFTCPSVCRAIHKAGCIPVFIDINTSFTLDTRDLFAKRDLIDLVVVTHTFGIPADMEQIRKIMSEKLILEDCAHAFLSEYKSKPCGTWGDASFFSINYGKFPSIGSGGFVLLNNPNLKKRFDDQFNKLADPGFLPSLIQPFKNLIYSIAFMPVVYGMITYPIFKTMDKKHDFIGKDDFNPQKGYSSNRNAFLKNFLLNVRINKDRQVKSQKLLSGLPSDSELLNIKGNNFYLLPILRKNRDQIYQEFFRAGFEAGKHFSKSIEWAVAYGYQKGSCPVAEKTADEILTLPNTHWLNDRNMKNIISILNSSTAL